MIMTGKLSVIIEGPEVDVMWRILQYYHDNVVNTNPKVNSVLTEEQENIRDRIHSALWHASCCQGLIKKGKDANIYDVYEDQDKSKNEGEKPQ
jgi:hypothetical protein